MGCDLKQIILQTEEFVVEVKWEPFTGKCKEAFLAYHIVFSVK